jgi:DNA-binding beta-propeller fold protein YncE
VSVINGDTDQVAATITGVGQPAIPDGCYLPGGTCTNDIGRIPPVYSGLDGIAVDEDTNRVYVAGTNDGRFVTIDGNTNTVINTQFIGTNQFNVAVNPLSHVVYSVSDLDSTLAVVDGKTGNPITKNIPVGSPAAPAGCAQSPPFACTTLGSFALGIAFNPNTGKLYVVDFGDFFHEPAVSTVVVLKTFGGDDDVHWQESSK